MRNFKLLLLSAMLFVIQGCITYNVTISPYLTEPIKQETFIQDFELIFNSNLETDLFETSAGKGNHTYTYSVNKPFNEILRSWFTKKFGNNSGSKNNKIIVTINNMNTSDSRQGGISSFPWYHNIDMNVGFEMQLNENNYQETFNVNKEFSINGGSQSGDIEHNVHSLLQSIVVSIDEFVSLKLMFEEPIGYFKKDFVASKEGVELKSKVLNFIDELLVNSLLLKTNLERSSIDLIQFKNKNYLTFKFSKDVIYNTRQSDKYKVAKIQFDELIRKILSPLNSNISDPELFSGYNIVITTYIQDFLNKAETLKKMEYRFLIPQDIAKKYKDKDITGQELIDNSIILMNDERIKLELN